MGGGNTLFVTGLLTAGILLLGPTAASASAADERIVSFDAVYAIGSDGVITVTEKIDYDFGADANHGIIRTLRDREPAGDGEYRIWGITDVEVSSPSGAPDDLDLTYDGDAQNLRIGDPDETVTGRQTYEITYRIEAGLNESAGKPELYWDVTGTGWSVPIDAAKVVVRAPGGIERTRCFAGPPGSKQACDRGTAETERVATFGQRGLGGGEGLTIVVGLAKGAVTVPPRRHGSLHNESGSALGEFAASAGPLQAGFAGALFLAGLGVAVVGYRSPGWDRQRYQRRLGLAPAIVPETGPPDDLPPALVGLLIDERADNIDLAATILDLAIRGHLRIRELTLWNVRDWELTRLQPPPGAGVTPFERDLLASLFGGGPVVKLSALRYENLGARFDGMKEGLRQESVRLGWFRGQPGDLRKYWTIAGQIVLAAGVVSAIWGLFEQQFGVSVIGAGLAGAGVVLWLVARAMSSRTAEGTALYERALGFKHYLEQPRDDPFRAEAGSDAGADRDGYALFARYLPYAMVFGIVGGWTRAYDWHLTSSGISPVAPVWYAAAGLASYEGLGHSLALFGDGARQALPTVRPDPSGGSSDDGSSHHSSGGSSGGGDSGSSDGGGGGGGGDSW